MNINIKLNTLTAEVSPLVWEHTDNEQIIVKLLPTSLAKNKVCLVWNREVYEFKNNTVILPIEDFADINQVEVRDILEGAIIKRWTCSLFKVTNKVVDGKVATVFADKLAQQQKDLETLKEKCNNLLERVKLLEGIDLFSEEI